MVRRVKAYLKSMKVITDEEELHRMSQEVEPPSGGQPAPSIPVITTVGLGHEVTRSRCICNRDRIWCEEYYLC